MKLWSAENGLWGLPLAPVTDPALLAALAAPRRPLSAAEKFEQKVSYVYGMVGPTISKEHVRHALVAAPQGSES
jgi:hypothetical protein